MQICYKELFQFKVKVMKTKEELLENLRSEKGSLDEKLGRLDVFLSNEDALSDQFHLGLLRLQRSTMKSYSDVLETRINYIQKS